MFFKKKTYTVSDNFTLTWHAGAMKTQANSIDSVKTALEGGADIFEVDVSFLPDMTPVLIHDDSPKDPSLPRLEEALALMAKYEKAQINLDLKSIKNVPAVDELIKKYSLEKRAFYTGLEKDWLAEVKKQSFLPCYINMHPSSGEKSDPSKGDKLMSEAVELGAIGINIHFSDATPTLIAAARRHGLSVSFWTPSTKPDIRFALSFSPDNITSRRPDRVKAVLEKSRSKK